MLQANVPGAIVCTSSPAGFCSFQFGRVRGVQRVESGHFSTGPMYGNRLRIHGIRVNAVVPGATQTATMWSNVPATQVSATTDQLCSEIPLGRLAQPTDPARALTWLLSDGLLCDWIAPGM
jgi:NAD(P)-dependent dehydrogenase (short-subunit alcohol dehydrogenase family)